MSTVMTDTVVGGHPEFLEARRYLLSNQLPVGRVYRVYSAGDALALRDDDGAACTTILFTTDRGLPKTALVLSEKGMILWDGWPAGG